MEYEEIWDIWGKMRKYGAYGGNMRKYGEI